ncbi:MAG: hypothetical protein NT150_15830 [Bacteroidetes bacterium]|nr:hypothetical protein [Bacteroidota bacterium]
MIKKEIKNKIKNSLPANELTIVRCTPNNEHELKWEDDKEFIYKENRFDVVKKTRNKDGSITYYCINDTQEKQLFANLHKLVKDKSGAENSLIKRMIEVHWIMGNSAEDKEFNFPVNLKQNNFSFAFSYQFLHSKSISSPPENI